MKLLYFTAAWCQPCKAVGPLVEEICAREAVEYRKVDVDAEQKLATKYGVRGVPTLLVIDSDGRPTKSLVGSKTRAEITTFIQAAFQS